MRDLFSILPRPSRYIGIEEGAVFKEKSAITLHIALAFPDMYEVGMSYLGHKILADIINGQEHWWAERVFAPCLDAAKILQAHNAPLCTLESDTPLAAMDAIGFSVTHEMCFTNILYMLELAGIPLHASQRTGLGPQGKPWPLIIAGGGCALASEPLAPFVDIMILGEGEECTITVLQCLEAARQERVDRQELLLRLSHIPGVYVPEFFSMDISTGVLTPLHPHHTVIRRQIVVNMNDAPYPGRQTIPFGAVHNRLALEIGRGCTRGCRFCQAGIVYRPARERSVPNLQSLLDTCLASTGFDDVSFLSLSTGDFSALKHLFFSTVDRCAQEQVSVSLPSLRVGSIDDGIMERMAGIRRTGATLAPEAGSQRLRDVINKGITEEGVILHIQKLYEHGWQQVKLYFMLGLPTETDEDVLAILDLCKKARDAAGPGVKGLQITAALSPFVPKPHTPFQWDAQVSREEIHRRVGLLLHAVKGEKRIKLRWHDPENSFLEGIFSRADRRLAPVVETAFRKGAVFPSWMEHFTLTPWLEAMQEHGFTPEEFTGPRDEEGPLAWDHLHSGVDKRFLRQERARALAGKITDDCRYGQCHQCGACDTPARPSLLREAGDDASKGPAIANQLNVAQRDQQSHSVVLDERGRVIPRFQEVKVEGKRKPQALADHLTRKAMQLRVWYHCSGNAVYISQLELQSIFERALRRARLPLAFSQGFHPLPLLSFGRALPVGVASECEWFSLYITEECNPQEVQTALNQGLPQGLAISAVEVLPLQKQGADGLWEVYRVALAKPEQTAAFTAAWQAIVAAETLPWLRETKKGPRGLDARGYFTSISLEAEGTVVLELDWQQAGYVSPQALCMAALGAVGFAAGPETIRLTKLRTALKGDV